MALTATIYNFDVELADGDRNVYESLALRVAQHPSESDEYLIARVLAPGKGLSDEFVESILRFAPLHDIGKIGVPDHILLKTGPLTPAEFEVMQSHVLKGVEIVEGILSELDLGAVRFHDLRHTTASYLAMSGATTAEIAEVLGHRTLAMVKRYAHLSSDHVASVVARMSERFLS